MDNREDFLKQYEELASSGDWDALNSFIHKETIKIQAENANWMREFNELMSYQNKGMEFEHMSMLEEAASQYELAISYGRNSERMKSNQYFHSIRRLAIVYRKLKRYDDEIRVIQIGLSEDITDSDRKKLAERLEKAIKLKAKQ